MSVFADSAQSSFNALAMAHGMVCQASRSGSVRYESKIAFLEIHYANWRSFELGVLVGELNRQGKERSFWLDEIMRSKGVDEASYVAQLATSKPEHLPKILHKLSKFVQHFAAEFLDGEEMAYAQMFSFRTAECEAHALRAAVRTASVAWEARNYGAVVEALDRFHVHLSPAQRAKLDISRRRLTQTLSDSVLPFVSVKSDSNSKD